jgi:hypothetical protein
MASAKELIPRWQNVYEGRKSYAERDPELVLAAKRLHRRSPKGHRDHLGRLRPTTDDGLQQQAGHAVLGILRQVDAGGAVACFD